MVCCSVILSLDSSTQGTNLACSSITVGAETEQSVELAAYKPIWDKNKTKRQPRFRERHSLKKAR